MSKQKEGSPKRLIIRPSLGSCALKLTAALSCSALSALPSSRMRRQSHSSPPVPTCAGCVSGRRRPHEQPHSRHRVGGTLRVSSVIHTFSALKLCPFALELWRNSRNMSITLPPYPAAERSWPHSE